MKTFAFILLSLAVNHCHAFEPDVGGIALPVDIPTAAVGDIKAFNPASISSPADVPSFAAAPDMPKLDIPIVDLKEMKDSDEFNIGEMKLDGIPTNPWVDPYKKGLTPPVTKEAVGVSFELEKLSQSKVDHQDCLANCMLNKKCAVAVFCTIPSDDAADNSDDFDGVGAAPFTFGGNEAPMPESMSGNFIGYCHQFANKSGISSKGVATTEWGTDCKSAVFHPKCRNDGFGVPLTWDELDVGWIPGGVRATYKCKAPDKYKKKQITKPIEAICNADGTITTSNGCETREKDESGAYKKPTLDLSDLLGAGSIFTPGEGTSGVSSGGGNGIGTDNTNDKDDTNTGTLNTGDTATNTPGTGDTDVDTSGTGDTSVDTSGTGDTSVDTSGTGDTNVDTSGTGDTSVDTSGTVDTNVDMPGTGDTSVDTSDTGDTSVDTSGTVDTNVDMPGTGDTSVDTSDTGDTSVDTSGTGDTSVDTSGTGDTNVDTSGTGDTSVDTSGTVDTNVDMPGTGDTSVDTSDTGDTSVDTSGIGDTNVDTSGTGDTNVDMPGTGDTSVDTSGTEDTNVDMPGTGDITGIGGTDVDIPGEVDTTGAGGTDVATGGTDTTGTDDSDKDKEKAGLGAIENLNNKDFTMNFEKRKEKLNVRNCPPYTTFVNNGMTAPKNNWVADNFCIFYEEDFHQNRPSSKPYVTCAATDYNDTPNKGIKKITEEMAIPDKELEGIECLDLCAIYTKKLRGWFPSLVSEDDVATCYSYVSFVYYNLNYIDTLNSVLGTKYPAPVLTSATMM